MFGSKRRGKQRYAEEGALQTGCPLLWVEHYAEIVPDKLSESHGDRISCMCNVTGCDAFRKFVVLSIEGLDSSLSDSDVHIHHCAIKDVLVEIH